MTATERATQGLDPRDDLPHAPPDVPGWTENYQWCATFRGGGGWMAHVGTMPTDPTFWHSVAALALPDGRLLVNKMVGPAAEAGAAGPANAAATFLDPYARWRWRFSGGMRLISPAEAAAGLIADGETVPVVVDCEAQAAGPVWSPTISDGELAEWAHFHHEQALVVKGEITVDGEQFEIDAVGHRDHSAGPRDMSGFERGLWCNGTLDDGWSFVAMWANRAPGEEFSRAAVFVGDTVHEATLTGPSLITSAAADPKRFTFTLESDLGVRHVEALCTAGMNWSVVGPAEFAMGTNYGEPTSYMLTQYFADLRCEGRSGLGFVDRGLLIRNLLALEGGAHDGSL